MSVALRIFFDMHSIESAVAAPVVLVVPELKHLTSNGNRPGVGRFHGFQIQSHLAGSTTLPVCDYSDNDCRQ